jgi:DNA-binding MarR family transcriptional regulator
VIDRLERAGFVRRAEDPADRRRVMIAPLTKRMERVIGPLFASMGQAAAELCARYTTAELAVIRDFTARAHQMAFEEARKLGQGTVAAGSEKTKAVPSKAGKRSG